jgi:periplasmic protein TonB
MFDQTFVNAQAQTRKPWTVLASLSIQAVVVLALLIAPLLRIAKLEAPPKVPDFLRVEKVDLKAKPETKPQPIQQRAASARPIFQMPVLQAPTTVPKHIEMTPDAPSIAAPSATMPTNVLVELPPGMNVQRPPEIQKPSPQQPAQLHVGGDVQAAKLIYSPRPLYPRVALTTRTQGTVVIRAVIARDGSIGHLQLIGGPPLLVQAAMDAVRQWRYKPTTLNGETVEVLTEISVNFTLNRTGGN